MLITIYKYEIVCDKCKDSLRFESSTQLGFVGTHLFKLPDGWTFAKKSEDGSGHYGLPRRHWLEYYCPSCRVEKSTAKKKKKGRSIQRPAMEAVLKTDEV